jgi:hypothetical protein
MLYCYENAILALAYYTSTGHRAIITFDTELLVVGRSVLIVTSGIVRKSRPHQGFCSRQIRETILI